MNTNANETAASEKDYLPERDKLFSELFTHVNHTQSLETEKPPQVHDEELGLTGKISGYFKRNSPDRNTNQRKEASHTETAADEELMLLRTRASKYWACITILLVIANFFLINTIVYLLMVPSLTTSISWRFLCAGLFLLVAIVIVKSLKLCLQSWSLLRQGKYLAIYLISFIMAPLFSESFNLLSFLLLLLQIGSFFAFLNSLSPRGTSWIKMIKTFLKNSFSQIRERKTSNNATNQKTPSESSFLPL